MASPAFLSVFWSMRRRPIISAPRTSCASEPKQIEGVETRRGLFIAEQVVKHGSPSAGRCAAAAFNKQGLRAQAARGSCQAPKLASRLSRVEACRTSQGFSEGIGRLLLLVRDGAMDRFNPNLDGSEIGYVLRWLQSEPICPARRRLTAIMLSRAALRDWTC